MMDMVEKVARALCQTGDAFDPDEEWDIDAPNFKPGKLMWEMYIPDARAAIEAMRRPTGAMKEAGANRLPDRSIDFAHDVYDTMINEALK